MIAAVNNLDIGVGDIKNTYIWVSCREKVQSIASSEFDKFEGMKILTENALYSLRTSGS